MLSSGTIGGIIVCVWLLESKESPIYSVLAHTRSDGMGLLLMYVVFPVVCGFLSGILPGVVASFSSGSLPKVMVWILVSPGVYVISGYFMAATPGRGEKPWEEWPWNSLLIIASLLGTCAGYVIGARWRRGDRSG
jgi:hypothetical protein